jgi:hypothetical protein
MIHVAEASEAKGRVVVHLGSGTANSIALDAALWLARAFQSDVEALFVENQQLLEWARYPFAREVSLSGRGQRQLSIEDLEREMRFASAAFHAELAARARALEVTAYRRIVRDEPVSALSAVCADCGPWNAVALAEPFTSPACPPLKDLLDSVKDATGLLVVGPRAARISGPIVVALEHAELLPAMVSAAQKLAAVVEGEVSVCLLAADENGLMELDNAARLVVAEHSNVKLVGSVVTFGAEAAAAEALRRLAPGLILARFGGLLMPAEGDLKPLAESLECPLLLLR